MFRSPRYDPYRNLISLSGIVVSAGSVVAFFFLFFLEIIAGETSAYIGILTYLVAPFFFFLGLSLVFGGRLLHGWLRRRGRGGETTLSLTLDFSDPSNRRKLLGFIAGTTLFLFASAVGSYKSYHVTESEAFCGEVCHEVMEPEYVAYAHSPHANISCTECHIGSGAAWFIKSKINGLHQVYATLTDSFDRPIQTPLPNLRPPRDICLNCHWQPKYIGNSDRSFDVILSDSDNTRFQYRLILDVGGGDPDTGPVGGIHWHMHVNNTLEFVATDPKELEIPWVRMTHEDGTVTTYVSPGFEFDPAVHQVQQMDCMDCHNRPSHRFIPPNDSLDLAVSLGRVSRELPDLKYTVVTALSGAYATTEEAFAAIEQQLLKAYGETPESRQAIDEVQKIYARTFFPKMKARWDVYPEHIGHTNFPGCFRCHDNDHVAAEGQRISASDCNSCHIVIAQKTGEEDWKMSLTGLEFAHPGGDFIDGLLCSDCHTGGLQLE
jgi:nitrate/TMAO reductase-like tetraheme cytochrome c subunit